MKTRCRQRRAFAGCQPAIQPIPNRRYGASPLREGLKVEGLLVFGFCCFSGAWRLVLGAFPIRVPSVAKDPLLVRLAIA
jgi:hypothetical protein